MDAGDIPPLDLRIRGFFNEKSSEELKQLLEEFYEATDIEEHSIFEKAIFLCQSPEAFNHTREDELRLTAKERKAIDLDWEPCDVSQNESRRLFLPIHGNDVSKWHDLPWPLWKLVILCVIGATVQGWDEAAVNGAQLWYQATFNIFIDKPCDPSTPGVRLESATLRPSIAGLVNSSPYLFSVVSCWLTPWLSQNFGRRGTVMLCAIFSIAFALGQAFVQSWQQLLVLRLCLGLAIGPKSVIIPIYIAECVPANIRGSLVMWWQVFNAFGIMAGSVTGVALQHLGDAENYTECPLGDTEKLLSWTCSLNWRLMLASPGILPILLALYIYGCPESPRWTIAKAHTLRLQGRSKKAQIYYQGAFKALNELARNRLLAARDIISHYFLLREERERLVEKQEKHPARPWLFHEFSELFLDRRNGRAILASSVCMFAQQFCGVNIIIYYSNIIFRRMLLTSDSSPSPDCYPWRILLDANRKALFYTMGFGIINCLFAVPAFFTIDTIGRRSLLLGTFPFLGLSNLITALGLAAHSNEVALCGMYLFGILYSPGEGPIPVIYAAESMPLHIREKGMSFVGSMNWLFNWVIAFTGPWFINNFGGSGTFFWYSGWCFILFFLILLLVPETRCLTLEQLDYVFREVSIRQYAHHTWRIFLWRIHYLNEGQRPPRLWEEESEQSRRCESMPLRRSRGPSEPDSSGTAVDHIEEAPTRKYTEK